MYSIYFIRIIKFYPSHFLLSRNALYEQLWLVMCVWHSVPDNQRCVFSIRRNPLLTSPYDLSQVCETDAFPARMTQIIRGMLAVSLADAFTGPGQNSYAREAAIMEPPLKTKMDVINDDVQIFVHKIFTVPDTYLKFPDILIVLGNCSV